LQAPATKDLVESNDESEDHVLALGDKTKRLIEWNVDLLMGLLRSVVARRVAKGESRSGTNSYILEGRLGATVLDEVLEVITLPKFDAKAFTDVNLDSIDLGPAVEDAVRNYVTTVALLYRENPFHNFEHASHVAMSVSKQ
jgi:uncharacterized membrane protein YeaQ/YmgE (transglycosylase-associated protein family)